MAHMVDLTHTERVSLVSELALEPSRSDFIVLPQAGAATQADSPSLCASSNEGVTLWSSAQADSRSVCIL